jgi:hypothetical protein
MRDKLILLVKSLAVTVAISALIGGTVALFGHPFWMWFLVSFIGQFLVSYVSNSFLEYKSLREARSIKLKEAEIVEQNMFAVSCASCKKESNVIIRTNQENKFTCGFCGAKNAVYLSAETALVTDPIYDAPALKNISL